MSLWDKIKNAGRSDEYDEYEDDYEREDEVAEEDEVPASRARSFRRRASSVDTEDDTPSESGSGRVMNVTTPTQLQVVLVKPTEFEDSIEIANSLKSMHTVVLNLESTNKDIARRILDFLSGVAYANQGKIKRVANNTYIITPYNVGIMGDLIDELENNGMYF
ncbi:MAG: cell division protein SepF [Clostridia bacterium]|nr:cell division protein SepF [Clostridia bacterium]MBQ4624288.1 cell division protein SepF [Clostridia bacterium]